MLWGSRPDYRHAPLETAAEEELSLVVLGDSQIGKSTLLEEYCGLRDADTTIESTHGVDIHCKKLKIGSRVVTVVFYDFGGDVAQRLGQEFFIKHIIGRRTLSTDHFPFSSIIAVFDCTTKNSLYQIKGWLQWFYLGVLEAYRKLLNGSNMRPFEQALSEVPVVVLGNKIDLMAAEPFLFFEMANLPKEQRENLQSFTTSVARRLRNHLCMTDGENLAFVSSECNPFKLSEVFDRILTAVYNKAVRSIMNEEFDICGVSISKCIKGKAFKEEILNSSWLSSFKGLLFRKQEPYLPL
jgi:GTPase SAR1 family protein